jgi:hypothetical protein
MESAISHCILLLINEKKIEKSTWGPAAFATVFNTTNSTEAIICAFVNLFLWLIQIKIPRAKLVAEEYVVKSQLEYSRRIYLPSKSNSPPLLIHSLYAW